MKLIVRRVFAVVFFFAFSHSLLAQELSQEKAFSLMKKNSAALGLSAADLQNVRITNAYRDNLSGLNLLYLQQMYQNVPVYNTYQVVVLKDATVQSLTGERIAKMSEKVAVDKAYPQIAARKAVGLAARAINLALDFQMENSLKIKKQSPDKQEVVFEKSPVSREEITSDLLWVPMENESIQLAWQVKILPYDSPDYWLIFIDSQSGEELQRVNLNISCSLDGNEDVPLKGALSPIMDKQAVSGSPVKRVVKGMEDEINSSVYRVIPFPAESINYPNGAPVLVTNPWLMAGVGNPAISLGWHNDGTFDFPSTRGNNVWAKEDRAGSNSSAGLVANSTTPAPNLSFDFAYNSNGAPDAGSNLWFSITNLFYWNNVLHDVLYQYGFDEVSGNFQVTNLGRGGQGMDPVLAEAQDGSGVNNANFSVGPDGNAARMQMFLWDGPPKTIYINAPSSAAGFLLAAEGQMSANNTLENVGPVTGDLVLYKDASTGGSSNFGCDIASNMGDLVGKIALIERGNCAFADKVMNAQQAGAKGVIIMDNVLSSELVLMGGDDNGITIPAVFTFRTTGNNLKAWMATATVNVTLQNSISSMDGGLDNGIIAHEYGHGVSMRLTGGPATVTCLQNREQMGEGWSDFYALMINTDWATATPSDGAIPRGIGAYASSKDHTVGAGIRKYPYSTNMAVNPLTYASLASIPTDKARPHEVGEIWAATLWDMVWNFVAISGINSDLYNPNQGGGNTDAMKLVTFAMKIQPCNPGFLDGRNALLKADELLFNGKYACAIWQAFARRGMGTAAKQGDPNVTTDQSTSYAVPAGARLKKTVDKLVSGQNGILTYTFTVKALCSSISNYQIVDTLPANVTWVSGGNYNSANHTVTITVASLNANQSQNFTIQAKIKSGTYFASSTVFSETFATSDIPTTMIANPVSGNTWNTSSSVKSSPYSVRATGTSGASVQILTSAASYPVSGHMELSFWNYYNTEASRDGGVVELSADEGATWIDAGPYMTQNGYNSTILANTILDNLPAFSGRSDGFIKTVINLSSFAGKHIRFRFKFVADQTIASNGWYVDDILITRAAAVYNLASLYSNTNLLQNISDTVTAITSEVLPVVWGTFTVEKDGSSARISWSTMQEFNTDQFIVERSTDGVNFTAIATVKAAGITSGISQYKAIDPAPLAGLNYYRIAQTDRDGKVVYSDVQTLLFAGAYKGMTITPNPAKDRVVIELRGNKELATVDLLNQSGQKVATFHLKEEKNAVTLPVLSPGVYYMRVASKTQTGIQKILIE